MHRKALQAVSIIGLVMGAAMCSSFEAGTGGTDPTFDMGAGGESAGAAGTSYSDPLKGGGKAPPFPPVPAGGGAGGAAGGGGAAGSDFGGGGTGGIESDEKLAECLKQAQDNSLLVSLSVDDSNDLASPAYVRDILKSEDGVAPNTALIKGQEFFNYYAIPYAEPGADPVGITAALHQISANPLQFRLLVGVTTPPPGPRPRVNIALVVDASVSMEDTGITRAKAIVKAIGKSLKSGDIVSLVTWSKDGRKLTGHVVSGPDDAKLVEVADLLAVDGGSDLQVGLTQGYELAEQHFDPAALNRLVLISDGRVTVGPLATGMVEKHALGGENNDKKVLLVGAATGPADGYDEAFMTKLTRAGRGSYVYVSSEAEATKLFYDRFDEVVGEPLFDNVKLTFAGPGYFSVPGLDDEMNAPVPQTSDVIGRPLAPGDSMTFNEIVDVCHLDVINDQDFAQITISWVTRGSSQAASRVLDLTVGDLRNNVHLGIQKAKAIAFFGDALQSGEKDGLSFALEEINSLNASWKLSAELPGEPDLEEMMALIKRHPNYSP